MLSVDDSVHLVAVGLTGLKQFWQRIQNCSSPMFKFAQNICLSLPSWFFLNTYSTWLGFPGGSEVKASASNVGDLGSIPGLGRSPGGGNGNPLQYSCLENPMDRGAWRAAVHGATKSQTWLGDWARTCIVQCISSDSYLWLHIRTTRRLFQTYLHLGPNPD